MKSFLTLALTGFIFIVGNVHAQQPSLPPMQGLNQQQLQTLMMHFGEIQQCMAQLGPDGMKRLQERSKQIQRETRTLCEAGKRDEALQHVTARSQGLMQSAEFSHVKGCSQNLWNQLAQPWLKQQTSGAQDGQHICDMIQRADQRVRAQPVPPVTSRPLPPVSPSVPKPQMSQPQY